MAVACSEYAVATPAVRVNAELMCVFQVLLCVINEALHQPSLLPDQRQLMRPSLAFVHAAGRHYRPRQFIKFDVCCDHRLDFGWNWMAVHTCNSDNEKRSQ